MNRNKIIFGVFSCFSLFPCFAANQTGLRSVSGRPSTPYASSISSKELYVTMEQVVDIKRVHDHACERGESVDFRLMLSSFVKERGYTNAVLAYQARQGSKRNLMVDIERQEAVELFQDLGGQVALGSVAESKFAFQGIESFRQEWYQFMILRLPPK